MKHNASYVAIQVLILVTGLFGTFFGCDSIHETFRYWPEIAYLEPFVLISCVLECLAILVVVLSLSKLLQLLLDNDRRDVNASFYLNIASYTALIADVYLLVAVAVFWAMTGLMHPSILAGYLLFSLFAIFLVVFCRDRTVASRS